MVSNWIITAMHVQPPVQFFSRNAMHYNYMRKKDVKWIEAFEMWRTMDRISWTEHRTNEEVLEKV